MYPATPMLIPHLSTFGGRLPRPGRHLRWLWDGTRPCGRNRMSSSPRGGSKMAPPAARVCRGLARGRLSTLRRLGLEGGRARARTSRCASCRSPLPGCCKTSIGLCPMGKRRQTWWRKLPSHSPGGIQSEPCQPFSASRNGHSQNVKFCDLVKPSSYCYWEKGA